MSQTVEFQFSQEALSEWDRIEGLMWQKIRVLVKNRASAEHRTMITEDDIKACLEQALGRRVIEDLELEDASA